LAAYTFSWLINVELETEISISGKKICTRTATKLESLYAFLSLAQEPWAVQTLFRRTGMEEARGRKDH